MNPRIFIFLILLLPLVSSANIGDFQLDIDNVEIYQTCNNCTSCNFTRVMSPTNQTLLSNLEATQDGTYFYYNILKGNFSDKGTYTYCYSCGNAVEKETGCLDFDITYTGEELTTQVASIYFLAIGVLIFLFFLLIYGARRIPNENPTDDMGRVLQISQLKHLRQMLFGVSWILIVAVIFIISNMAIAYLPNAMIGELFFVFYQIMFWSMIIILPLWFIKIFVDIWRDREVKQMLERGVDINTP